MTDPAIENPTSGAFRPLAAIVTIGSIQVLTMLASLIRTKIVAIGLGPSGVGVASVIDQLVSLVVQLGSLSIPFAILKFVSRARGPDPVEERLIYATLIRVLLVASAVATLGGVALTWLWPGVVGEALTPYRAATLLGLCSAPAIAVGAAMRNTVAAKQRDTDAALFTLASALALVGTSYVGVTLAGLAGLFAGNLVAQAAIALAVDRYLRRSTGLRILGTDVIPLRALLRERPEMISFAGAMYVLALTSPLTYLVSRSMVLNSRGAEAAGIMAAAYGVSVAVRQVLNQANTLHLTPRVNQSGAAAERAAAAADYARALTVILGVAGVVLVAFPGLWISLLYSSRFTAAVPVLAAFIVAEGLLLMAGVFQALLVGIDDIKGHVLCTVGSHLAIVALSLWLIPRHGALGVALSFAAGHALLLIACGSRLAGRHRFRVVLAPLGMIGASMSVVSVFGWAVATGTVGAAWLRTTLAVALSAAFLAFLRPAERRWILRPLRWFRPGS